MMVALLAFAVTAPAADYDERLARLESDRVRLAEAYRAAPPRGRRAILAEARARVTTALVEEIFPAWYGTPWDFYGTSEEPGSGTIACGHFVSVVLRHAGFRFDRLAMGRLASEHIAINLAGRENLRRYSRRTPDAVIADLTAWGPGVYVVGLDDHAALAVVPPAGEPMMIHSTVWAPAEVKSEPLASDNPFTVSKYRVLARLFDDAMMKKWLGGERFASGKP